MTAALRVENLSKSYRLGTAQVGSFNLNETIKRSARDKNLSTASEQGVYVSDFDWKEVMPGSGSAVHIPLAGVSA